jgi:hypothetical protein
MNDSKRALLRQAIDLTQLPDEEQEGSPVDDRHTAESHQKQKVIELA